MCNFWKIKTINPSEHVTNESATNESTINKSTTNESTMLTIIANNPDYYALTLGIRNSQSLTTENLEFIENLNRESLIELAKLYNDVITQLRNVLNETLSE